MQFTMLFRGRERFQRERSMEVFESLLAEFGGEIMNRRGTCCQRGLDEAGNLCIRPAYAEGRKRSTQEAIARGISRRAREVSSPRANRPSSSLAIFRA